MPPEMYERAFVDGPHAMAVVDPEGNVVAVSSALCELVELPRELLLAPGGLDVLAAPPPDPGAVVAGESGSGSGSGTGSGSGVCSVAGRHIVRWRVASRGRVTFELTVTAIDVADDDRSWYVLYLREALHGEADAQDELVSQLTYQAFHDPLTGLANRMLFSDRLDHALARAARLGSGSGAVLLLDLDDFKGVNDTLGHHVGDELLVAVATRLRDRSRASDTLCRFGGDEFLLLVEGLENDGEIDAIATRLMSAFAEPFVVGGTTVIQEGSLGIVPWSLGDEDPSLLIARADTAMYEAKRLGKGRHVVFDPEVHERAVQRFELAQDLRGALAAGELSMYFQPLIDLETRRVEGFEALMRWAHPTKSWVPPDVFIAIAEESDLIFELGAYALEEATRRAMSWTDLGLDPAPYVSVNLSTRQLYDPHLVRIVENALTNSGLPPSRLVLEVTESAALGDTDASSAAMQRLVQLGIRIAIDDFGTGYSSLSYFSLMYPKIIKIDHELVRGCDADPDRLTLLEGIVALGHSLGATVVAEGIETPKELSSVRSIGCEVGQGYLFSPAVDQAWITETVAALERDRQREHDLGRY